MVINDKISFFIDIVTLEF